MNCIKQLAKFCVVVFLTLSVLQCRRTGVDDALNVIDQMISANEYEAAQSLCDELLENVRNDNSTVMTPSRLCRLAVDFMTLSEQNPNATESDENITTAVALFTEAKGISEDSVLTFISQAINEQSANAEVLFQLTKAADRFQGDDVEIIFEEPDSIVAIDENK